MIPIVNGVGGTWFPLALTSHDPCDNMNQEELEEKFISSRKTNNSDPQNKAEALKLGQGFKPGEQGLLVKGIQGVVCTPTSENPNVAWIKKGDAIAFYNYKNDGSGRLNWRALHTGLPTSKNDGEKWIANHWFRLGLLSND